MKIQQLNTPKLPNLGRVQIQQQDSPPPPPPSTTMVDRIIDKTYLGANFTASTLSGGVGGAGGFFRPAPGAAALPPIATSSATTDTAFTGRAHIAARPPAFRSRAPPVST